MSMTQITRANLQRITEDAEAALEAVAKKHGVDIRYKSGRYSNGVDGEMKFTVEVADAGDGMSGAEAKFRKHAPMLGIDPDAFGKMVLVNRVPYEICGYYPAPKFNIEAKHPDGRVFRLAGRDVAREYPLQAAA